MVALPAVVLIWGEFVNETALDLLEKRKFG